MPELPEVETVRKGLRRYLVGHKILGVEVRDRRVFRGETKAIERAEIKDVRRFAKVLSIDLSNKNSIVIHIKLTGQLIYRGPNLKNPPPLSGKVLGLGGKHTHATFKLDKDGFLYYNDVRKFGWIKTMKTSEVEKSEFIGKLGPEPFKNLTPKKFKEIISKYKNPIKIVLMDQAKIGGIGNIYANDALWLAKIHPKKPANSLTDTDQKKLYEAILTVLKRGIESGGASELAFVTAEGRDGGYQKFFLAYGQQGKVCQHCKKTKIQKTFMGGRGTYLCPTCQKLKPKRAPFINMVSSLQSA